MGSMGSVVGERLTRLIERATEQDLPLIIVSGSGGGARMHEGILSLMQMAKVSAALARYDNAGGLYISVLTHPTMGGVAASFALLGDVVFAEPKALIGFAGPRTIKATIRLELPDDFQTSEFLMKHGYIDRIVRRPNLKTEIARTIGLLWQVGGWQLDSSFQWHRSSPGRFENPGNPGRRAFQEVHREAFSNANVWTNS